MDGEVIDKIDRRHRRSNAVAELGRDRSVFPTGAGKSLGRNKKPDERWCNCWRGGLS